MQTILQDFSFSPYLSETVTNYLVTYLRRFKSANTQKNYCLAINEFADFIKKDLTKVTAADCESYILHLESKRNAGHIRTSTVAKKKAQLSSLFSVLSTPYAKEQLSLPASFDNFFLDIRTDAVPVTLKYEKIPLLDELDRLHVYLSEHDPMIGIGVLLAFKGLLLMEEFRNLTVHDFFMDAEERMVVRVVNPSFPVDARYNSIPSDVKELLLSYFESLETIFPVGEIKLFAKSNGTVYTPQNLRFRLRNACDACGIRRYNFNDLRNAGIAYARSYNADVSVIANALGLKTNRHIGRLDSLKVTINDSADLIGISFKATVPPKDKED